MRIVAALAGQARHAQHPVGAGVEQVDGRVHGPIETIQGNRAPQADGFRVADGHRFGRQFAHDDVQEGNHAEGQHEGNAVYQFLRGEADGAEYGFEQAGKGRFADPAQAQRRQRDAQLAGGQVGVQLAMHLGQDAAP